MNYQEKITDLRKKIKDKLSPLIDNDYVLLDLPYHKNIGDILIWAGEIEFLKTLKHCKCLGLNNMDTFLFPKLEKNVIILLHGGGNFGDLYRSSQNFKLKVISTYPDNKIILLPQSFHYDNTSLIYEDAKVFQRHRNLYLCARDNYSYEMMLRFFSKNNVLLVPDSAFFITVPEDTHTHHSSLYIRRRDSETLVKLKKTNNFDSVSDWPTFEKFPPLRVFTLQIALAIYRRLPTKLVGKAFLAGMIDYFARVYIKDFLVELGIKFLKPYDNVTSDRLHGLILSVILGKSVFYIDNKTNKLSNFVSTWLADLDQVNKRNLN